MTETRAHRLTPVRNPSLMQWNAARFGGIAVLFLALLMPAVASAQDATSEPRQLLAPISDVLSAASWLWATGLDPRDPIDSAPSFAPTGGMTDAADASRDGGSLDVSVTRQVGLTPVSAEPALAVDPRDPSRVVLAVSALDLPSPAVYVSEDGGSSWDGPIQVPVQSGNERSIGAPVVAFDRQGVLFLAAQTVRIEELTEAALPLSVIHARLSVARSEDGGRTWQSAVAAVQGETNLGLAPDASGVLSGGFSLDFLDSPSLIVAPNPRQPASDTLTLAYTEFRTRYNVTQSPTGAALTTNDATSTIRIVQSTDGGSTWSSPTSVSPSAVRGIAAPPMPGAPPTVEAPPETIDAPVSQQPSPEFVAPGDQVLQGPHLAAFADGSLAIAYLDSTLDGPRQGLARVVVVTSADGGHTFTEPMTAAVFRETAAQPTTAFFRWWDSAFPSIAAGPAGDLVIMVATRETGDPADESDILIVHSPDHGATWDKPPVDASLNSGSAFFPALAAAPDGSMLAGWLALGESPAGVGYSLRLLSSGDDGVTWTPIEELGNANDDAFPNALLGYPGGAYLGGRLAIATTNEQSLTAWSDTSTSAANDPGQQVSVRVIPAS